MPSNISSPRYLPALVVSLVNWVINAIISSSHFRRKPLQETELDRRLRPLGVRELSGDVERDPSVLSFQLCSPSLRVEAKPPHKPQNLQKCNVVHVIIGDDGEVLPVTHRILTPDFIDTWERADTTNTERYS